MVELGLDNVGLGHCYNCTTEIHFVTSSSQIERSQIFTRKVILFKVLRSGPGIHAKFFAAALHLTYLHVFAEFLSMLDRNQGLSFCNLINRIA